jgi:hypothetical protein
MALHSIHTPRMVEASSCDFMLSSESKKTARTQTTADGDMVSYPIWMSLSAGESLPRFVAEPYHVSSVFFVLCCISTRTSHSWRRTSPKPSSHIMDLRWLAKNLGPNTKPCGTPIRNLLTNDESSPITATCVRSTK